ncbi:GGDEF domain-containing protein [Sphingomonas adhaesiva]|uniref:GGDEF domain-containing protein n=1 Tax=Sphingomonas adhaesiva TaxID=28212 RepID=UPI002FF49189
MAARLVTALGALLAFVMMAPVAQANAGMPLATCIRAAHAGESAAAMLAHPDGFDCTTKQRRWGAGDFWVLSQPLPATQATLVRSVSLYQQSATIHVLYADGAIRRVAFDHRDAWRHLKLGAVFEVAIPAHAARPVRLLWQIRGAANTRGILLSPNLATPAQSQRHEVGLAALYAAFAGVCASLLISNLALWRSLRQRFQPPYCAMVACLMVYGLSTSGVLGPLLRMDNNQRLLLNMMLLATTLFLAIAFARSFFGLPVLSRRMRYVADAVMAYLLAISATYALLMPWHSVILDRLVTFGFAAGLSLTVPVIWGAWRARLPYVRTFALAWGVPVMVAGLRIGQALGLIGWSFWVDNSTLIAMVMEAVTSAMVIAWRIKLISQERDAAREKESLALRLADCDPLTGLLNRRALLREVLASGSMAPRLLILVDIDHFRQVNDALGHDGGDEVLRNFARTLQAAAPPDALVARLGGEEFAVISPSQTTILPDRLLDAIRGTRMPFDLRVTASLGSSIGYLEDESDWTRLYREADRALYVAKNAGRDRARWAQAA